MTYKPTPTETEGGRTEAVVSDDEVRELLTAILVELRTMNVQLALVTDEELDERDTLKG